MVEEGSEQEDFRQRVLNADRTHNLILTIKSLERTDFTAMMGSGVMVRITPITKGRTLTDEFLMAAEDMSDIAPLMVESLKRSLDRRKLLLKTEIADIEKAIQG